LFLRPHFLSELRAAENAADAYRLIQGAELALLAENG
jgi:hypothetical protein